MNSDKKRSICNCEKCKLACTVKPGIFKFEQIEEVANFLQISIETLFENYLGVEYASMDGVTALALAPATTNMKPGSFYSFNNQGTCVFLDKEENCIIHPVSPFECQQYTHTKLKESAKHTRKEILRTWINHLDFIRKLTPIYNQQFYSNITLQIMNNTLLELSNLYDDLKNKNISIENALDKLNEHGHAVCLMNDDNNHWAATSDGFQQVPETKKSQSMTITAFIEKKQWKKSIHEAIIAYVEDCL